MCGNNLKISDARLNPRGGKKDYTAFGILFFDAIYKARRTEKSAALSFLLQL